MAWISQLGGDTFKRAVIAHVANYAADVTSVIFLNEMSLASSQAVLNVSAVKTSRPTQRTNPVFLLLEGQIQLVTLIRLSFTF